MLRCSNVGVAILLYKFSTSAFDPFISKFMCRCRSQAVPNRTFLRREAT
jgi:hypothetical protein